MFFIMRLVPESHKWEAERDKGATSHWATRDLLGVLIGAIGAAFVVFLWSPVFDGLVTSCKRTVADTRRHDCRSWRIAVRGVGSVFGIDCRACWVSCIRSCVTWSGPSTRAHWTRRSRPLCAPVAVRRDAGGSRAVGHLGLAPMGAEVVDSIGKIIARRGRPVLRQRIHDDVLGARCNCGSDSGGTGRRLVRTPTQLMHCSVLVRSCRWFILYQANDAYGAKFLWSVFVAGGITAAFYGWFPLYLPELFPTSIRATSQGFAFNFGRVHLGRRHAANSRANELVCPRLRSKISRPQSIPQGRGDTRRHLFDWRVCDLARARNEGQAPARTDARPMNRFLRHCYLLPAPIDRVAFPWP